MRLVESTAVITENATTVVSFWSLAFVVRCCLRLLLLLRLLMTAVLAAIDAVVLLLPLSLAAACWFGGLSLCRRQYVQEL